jgi:hypothetical protein
MSNYLQINDENAQKLILNQLKYILHLNLFVDLEKNIFSNKKMLINLTTKDN